MSKIDSWITKIPRLKNSKVARFSYRADAYANDDIEGVENYDYSRDMNVPLATHTDFDPDMLSIGARTNFSSVPKNGLNHFFGRVSYNLNKVIDFLSDFLDDFISLNNSFISFTEIVSFSSSATLANYADGATKRLLNTAGSTITITLPAGETYLGSNTITLAPSIMLTMTKRGTVWVNSSGTAITALTADKWKTARNVTISDADGTNTGTAVSVDGSENETLKLPATIKANLTGNVTGNVTGNANTSTAPLYQWKKEGTDLFRSVAGEGITYYWHKLCKITTAMTFDIEVVSDNNYSYRASYRLSVSTYTTTTYTSYSVSLFNLGQAVISEANLAVALDADGYLYLQTNAVWSSALFVTLLYSTSSGFSVTMDKLGYASFGTASGFTPIKLITQTGAFRWSTSGTLTTYTPMINTNIIGNVTGNASTATKLETARKINGVDFDGTADVYDTYSTTEHRIGTWIDGKPLYRKVVNFGALPNNAAKNVVHGIINLGSVTRLSGVAHKVGIADYLTLPHSNSSDAVYSIALGIVGNNVEIQTGTKRDNYTATIIIEYTKTTID